MRVTASYKPAAIFENRDAVDERIREIFKRHMGVSVGSGQLMVEPYDRDIEYEIPDGLAQTCATELLTIKGVHVDCL